MNTITDPTTVAKLAKMAAKHRVWDALQSVNFAPNARGQLIATIDDLDRRISVEVGSGSDTFTMPAADLVSLSSNVSIDVDHASSEYVMTFSEGGSANGRLIIEDDFPKARTLTPTNSVQVSGADIATLIGTASKDLARPVITGILFDEGKAVSTNSYILTIRETIGATVTKTLIQASAFKSLQSLAGKKDPLSVTATDDDMHAIVEAGRFTMTVRVIDGQFPQWQSLVPASSTYSVTVDNKALQASVKAVAFKREKNHCIPITVTDNAGTLELSAQQEGNERARTVAIIDGHIDIPAPVGFDPDYLTHLVKGHGAKVKLSGIDTLKPWLITSDEVNGMDLICPVRLPGS